MTKEDFFRNNRGINDGANLPEELLGSIYDEIQTNEIRMKDEVDTILALPSQGPGIASALAYVGRDLQKEAYVMQSLGMANKTEVKYPWPQVSTFQCLIKRQCISAGTF